MTQALAARFGPDIEVVLHAGGCGRLAPDEARLLGTRRRHGQVREVRLRAGRTGLLAARTVYVSRRLRTHPTLVGLGSRPLGELLFVGVRPRRKQRQYARRVPVRIQPEGRPGAVGRRCCWARRTVYLYERQRLLVTEIFLPAMLR